MHSIEERAEGPDREVVRSFDGIPSSIVSDVTGTADVAMDSGIKPLSDGTTLAGTALTVDVAPGDNLIIHKAITMAEPGDVLVIDAKGYVEAAHLGELMCTSCKVHDLAGVVIDGAVRDRKEIVDMGFPVYARGVHPKGPLKQNPGSINVTVSCGRRTVEPGDVVVGDDEGVAVVPADQAESVLEDSREKLAAEDDARERATAGEYLFEINGYDELFEELEIVGPEESV